MTENNIYTTFKKQKEKRKNHERKKIIGRNQKNPGTQYIK